MSATLKHVALGVCSVLAMSLVAAAALADGGRGRMSREPQILGVTVEPCPNDPEATCLHLIGTRIHDHVDPLVTLSGSELEIHELVGPGTNVYAVLPEDMEAATHEVQVMNALGTATREVPLPATGAMAIPGYTTHSSTFMFNAGAAGGHVTCPEGTVVVGGGYLSTDVQAVIWNSGPLGQSGWQSIATGPMSSRAATLTVMAICFDPGA